MAESGQKWRHKVLMRLNLFDTPAIGLTFLRGATDIR